MISKPLLRYGSTGSAVVELQHRLNFARDTSTRALVPDGIFGPKTLAAVKVFQTRGIPVLGADGMVGPLTRSKLLVVARGDIQAIATQIQEMSGSAPHPLAHFVGISMTRAQSDRG